MYTTVLQLPVAPPCSLLVTEPRNVAARLRNMAAKQAHHSWSRLHELTETLHEIVKGAGTKLLQHSFIKLKSTLQNPQEDETKLLQILFPITITMAFHKIEITSTYEGEL